MKECVYAKCSFNYIKRRHRAYLWMFRMRMSADINDKTGTVTVLHYKWAFGHQFIMGEEVRKFKTFKISGRPYGKQYVAFQNCVTQIEASQNTVFVGKKWMMMSMEHYKKIADIVQNKTNSDAFPYIKPKWRDFSTEMVEMQDYINKRQTELKRMWLDGNRSTEEQKLKPPFFSIPSILNHSTYDEKIDILRKHYLNNKKREETMKSNIGIARVCHEANRQYCIDNEKTPQLKWDELPKEIQESIIAGVAEVIANPKITPAEMHQKWCDFRKSKGWKYAPSFTAKFKTHPNLVPFNKLPKVEQAKDKLFIKTVKAEMKK